MTEVVLTNMGFNYPLLVRARTTVTGFKFPTTISYGALCCSGHIASQLAITLDGGLRDVRSPLVTDARACSDCVQPGGSTYDDQSHVVLSVGSHRRIFEENKNGPNLEE